MDSGLTQQQIQLLSVLKGKTGSSKSLDKIKINNSETKFAVTVTKVENIFFFFTKNQGTEESCLSIITFKMKRRFQGTNNTYNKNNVF